MLKQQPNVIGSSSGGKVPPRLSMQRQHINVTRLKEADSSDSGANRPDSPHPGARQKVSFSDLV